MSALRSTTDNRGPSLTTDQRQRTTAGVNAALIFLESPVENSPLRVVIVAIMFVSLLAVSGSAGKIGADCSYRGTRLHGRVKFVTSFAAFRVKVVAQSPDLRVQIVNQFPNRCGQWQVVSDFPDFTVQQVDAFGDFTIQYVANFPGVGP